jgi:FSR family fosmidomycin resistance protein-like MFS transporter
MSTRPENLNVRVIFALTLIHFTGDFYNSFVTPLLPVFADRFVLTLTEVGLIGGLSRFLAFIVQPNVGYLADRYRTRFFILGGLLIGIVFIPLTGIAPTFLLLLVFVALGSTGSAMFHPSVAGMVYSYAGSRPGLSMSIFNTGGTLAFALGPVFIAWYVSSRGLEAMPVIMLPGLMLMVYLYRVVPVPDVERFENSGFVASFRETFGEIWRWIALIWLIMVFRSFAEHVYRTFVPVLFVQEGYSLVAVGVMISLFTLAGTLSGLLAGHLSDRIGFKKIFYTTYLLSVPSLMAILFASGFWLYPAVFLAGFFIMATLPLGVTMGQELAPKGRSMVASLMMGFAFGFGGTMTPVAGAFADALSIRTVLAGVAVIPALLLGLVYFLPDRRERSPDAGDDRTDRM